MKKANLNNLISDNLIFQELEKSFVDILAENSVYLEIEPEVFIFSAREVAKNFYLILEGQVSIQMFSHEKGSITIEEIKPGNLLGWSWLKTPNKWQFDTVTLTKTKLISFDAKKIMEKMNENKAFGFAIQNIFLNIIIERLQATRLRLLNEFGDNIYIPD